MALDQVENFVEVNVSGDHSSTETIISLQSGEASNLPDPSSGEFNLVWFDSTNFSRPSEDNSVEIVRVTGRDTTNDTITVLRGQENTTAVAHDTTNSDYVMILAQTAKMIEDVDAADFSTNTVTVAGNSVTLGGSTAVATGDLSDQNITTPSAGQTILYDASAGEFVNGFISAGTALGSTSGDGVFTLNVDETGINATKLDGSAGSAGQFLQTDGSNLTFASVSAKAFEEVADFASIPSNPETGEGFTTTDKGELFVEVNN